MQNFSFIYRKELNDYYCRSFDFRQSVICVVGIVNALPRLPAGGETWQRCTLLLIKSGSTETSAFKYFGPFVVCFYEYAHYSDVQPTHAIRMYAACHPTYVSWFSDNNSDVIVRFDKLLVYFTRFGYD